MIAFLDIEGAFNNVLPAAIAESLTELGVEPPMMRLIHKLLISRMVTATVGTRRPPVLTIALPGHRGSLPGRSFSLLRNSWDQLWNPQIQLINKTQRRELSKKPSDKLNTV